MFNPLIHILLPHYILGKLIVSSISAQLRYFSEPNVRLTFVLEEGLVDALAARFELELEFLDLLFVLCFIVLRALEYWEVIN